MRRPQKLAAAAAPVLFGLLGAGAQAQRIPSRFDMPTAQAWTVRRSWDAQAERGFSAFVSAIGHAVAAGRCRHLSDCLNRPSINPLHVASGTPLRFRADCADVPYTLRAYFAFHHGLPFAWARSMRGHGGDPRYLRGARAEGQRLWSSFSTPRHLFEQLGSEVHSGYLRTSAESEDGDFYQATVAPGSIHPGSVYYDPNGHVLVVYEVSADGEVLLFDGHPDNSLSHVRLSSRYPLGTAASGGGFKNFRPLHWNGTRVGAARNASLRDFGGASQFDRNRYGGADYYGWVREALRAPASIAGPLAALQRTPEL